MRSIKSQQSRCLLVQAHACHNTYINCIHTEHAATMKSSSQISNELINCPEKDFDVNAIQHLRHVNIVQPSKLNSFEIHCA